MAGDAEFAVRACCAAGAQRGVGITEPAEGDDFKQLARGPLIDATPAPPDEATAYHEAGHAVVAYGLGGSIRRVRIEHPGQVEFGGGTLADADRIAVAYAGPAAEHAFRRWEITIGERDEEEFLTRAAACSLGSCDQCHMALFATRLGTITETDSRAHFRAGQLRANALVRLPAVRRAIAALAAALIEQPIMDGAAAEAILFKFMERGALAAVESLHAPENPSRNGCDHLSAN